MNKSVIILLFVVLACVSAIHLQTYAPSKPGGTYYGTNGTSSGTTYPNYNTYPTPSPYPSYPTPSPTPNYGGSSSTSTTGIFVNGQPYYYTGPFRLVCYVQNSTQIFRQDSCYDAYSCANNLNQYRNCLGRVAKFNL